MTDRYDRLEQLDQLRKNGTLSEEEFEIEKRRLLNERDEGKAPTTTIIKERSSFGSIVFGGLVLILLAGAAYWFFMNLPEAEPEAKVEAPIEMPSVDARAMANEALEKADKAVEMARDKVTTEAQTQPQEPTQPESGNE